MSELFDEDPRDEPADRPPSRRSRALVITAIVLVLAFFGLTTFANFYTNVLWYSDIGFGGVYSRLLWTKIALFAVFVKTVLRSIRFIRGCRTPRRGPIMA